MSYENTECPCRGRKERETMLCKDCNDHFAGSIEMAAMNDTGRAFHHRRNAAIRLLSMARKRDRKLGLKFAV